MRDQVGLVRASTAAGVALLVCACGHVSRPLVRSVTLSLRTPSDASRTAASSVTISGVVSPGTTRVLVTGQAAKLDAAGDFSTTVSLKPGTNLIDVIASGPHARPAMTALRVLRYVLITVPKVTGQSPASAAATISGAGLKPQLRGDPDPLSFLLPLPQRVCGQTPGVGARVEPNSTVTLQLGKVCT